jgi:hypothetical protein
MYHNKKIALLLSFGLASCGGGGGADSGGGGPGAGGGGGGGGGNDLRVTYSTNAVTFSVEAPWSPRPANATLTGSLTGQGAGTLYIVISVNSPELFSVTDVNINNTSATGTMTIVPVDPNSLGSGLRTGSFDIRVCLNDPACNTGQVQGSPFRVNVTYDVPSMVDADTVTPGVVEASKAGAVVLRGRGFTNATTVQFGGVAATSVTYVSPTELRANYPALVGGDHAVTLNNGALPFAGVLTAVTPVAFPAHFIPHAIPTPAFPDSVVYDAPRRAIIFNARPGDKVIRYAWADGAWQGPTTADVTRELQMRMSYDNSTLLVMQDYEAYGALPQLMELDPVTLAVRRATSIEGYPRTFALANDGNLIISTRLPGSGSSSPIVFGINRRTTMHVGIADFFNAGTLATGDGGKVYVPGMSNVGVYDASTGRWQTNIGSDLRMDNLHYEPPDSNTASTRFRSSSMVFDANLRTIGFARQQFGASKMNAEGTRLYAYMHESNIGYLRTFDLTLPPVNGEFLEVGAPIQLAGTPGGDSILGPRMALTPDGNTIFIAGVYGVAVQPTPP